VVSSVENDGGCGRSEGLTIIGKVLSIAIRPLSKRPNHGMEPTRRIARLMPSRWANFASVLCSCDDLYGLSLAKLLESKRSGGNA
jgi:hypothetical protein